ncbi:trypsin-like serine protease [Ramicandelaber brevisporus]|nr:trypsin-like serine protease [Ramicandelaber brevisporus]
MKISVVRLAAGLAATLAVASAEGSSGIRIHTKNREPAAFQAAIAAAAAANPSGGPAPHILGGTTAKSGELPFIVLYNYVKPDGTGEQCGGSILDKNWILTAAHCVTGDGGVKLSSRQALIAAGITANDDFEKNFTRVSEIIVHEGFIPLDENNSSDPKSLTHDIALLRLEKPLTFSDKIKPIKISSTQFKTGTKFGVAGWGLYDITNPDPKKWKVAPQLLKTTVTGSVADACSQISPEYKSPNGRQICTIDQTTSSCMGDSGGPLYYKESNGDLTLAGLVSFGAQTDDKAPVCGSTLTPSFYTNAYSYRNWIATNMKVDVNTLLANSSSGNNNGGSGGNDGNGGNGGNGGNSAVPGSSSFSGLALAAGLSFAAAMF